MACRSRLQRSGRDPLQATLAPPTSRLQLRPGPRGQKGGGEGGISQRGDSGFPTILSVYGEKGEMERAGGRWLAHAAPPPGRVRRRESGPSRAAWAGLSAPGLTTHLAREPVAQAPASATAAPRGPSASGSGAPVTRCAPSRRGAAAGAPGLRGRTEAAGNSGLGGSGVSFWSQPCGIPQRFTS